MMGVALGLLLHVVPAFADDAPVCVQPTTVADFLGVAQLGEQAFAGMNLPALSMARDLGLDVIPCLGEPITPRDAAAFHRMMALAAFTSGDSQGVMREFHAARRLEPGYQIPATVAPPGHSLVMLYERSVSAEEGELQPTIPPQGGWVGVDGVRGAPRPDGISTIVQVFDQADALQQSLYLLPEDPLPVWGPMPIDQLRRKRRRASLLIASGSALSTSVVFYGVAMRSKAEFWADQPRTYEEIVELRLRTNGLAWASLGTVFLAGGLGVTTAVLW